MTARLLTLAAAGWLAACAAPPTGPGEPLSSVRFTPVSMPRGVARSNADLAEDFLDLTLRLESGEPLDRIVRYEEPIRVHVRSAALAPYRSDIDELLARLRDEAAIDIAETDEPDAAQLHIEAVPASEIRRVFPTAACFIVPDETSWDGFVRRPSGSLRRWSDQTRLEGAAIFVPADTTPQDVRDCLNEEITQALGVANDLYRLPDSIFNDDNFHGTATRFDMLMLRTLYRPEIESGMSREAVAAALPGVLARINPEGRRRPRSARHPESRAWASAIEAALSRDVPHEQRLGAAQVATQVAVEMRPRDHRLGVSLLALGRLNLRRDPLASARNFGDAYTLFRDRFGVDDIRTAQAGVHLAAIALATGNYQAAVRLADLHAPSARAGRNAILLAGLLSIKADSLAALGDSAGAHEARLDSLRWARYGFGDTDGALAREQAQLAALMRLEEG
jgi:Protein of unknown function (DUF2927)